MESSKGTGPGTQGLLNDVSIDSSALSMSPPATSQNFPANESTKENQRPGGSNEIPAVTTKESQIPAPTSSGKPASDIAAMTSSQPATTAPGRSRLDSVAIGPSTDTPLVATATATDPTAPVCIITLLLTSGARHPYKIDEKYLTKRNVNVPGATDTGKKDPFSISVYTLKELILREWREEWEVQPSSPSSIRLIHFGRLLDDKTPLNECRFNTDAPNVVHMTVKPQEMLDEEDASKSKATGRDRDGGERTAGCRCVIL